jgi:TolB-like protein
VGSTNLPASGAIKGGRSRALGHDISSDEVRGELERILSSSMFSTADRMTRFLRFVVEETLAGRGDGGDDLNELLLGMAVYDRDRKFDPRVDSIVRVDAGRLRAKLREFYASEGLNSSIGIEIPKGSYKAVFKRLQGTDPPNLPRLRTEEAVAAKPLAVLPFVDLSPQRDHEFLGDGIVEELIHALSSIPGIRVVSLTSVLALKNDRMDVKELGRQLGVECFIEGSVRRVNRRIRIMVRLTDAATGFHTWSKAYALVSRDVFATQEKVSKAIVEALNARIGKHVPIENKKKRPSK